MIRNLKPVRWLFVVSALFLSTAPLSAADGPVPHLVEHLRQCVERYHASRLFVTVPVDAVCSEEFDEYCQRTQKPHRGGVCPGDLAFSAEELAGQELRKLIALCGAASETCPVEEAVLREIATPSRAYCEAETGIIMKNEDWPAGFSFEMWAPCMASEQMRVYLSLRRLRATLDLYAAKRAGSKD